MVWYVTTSSWYIHVYNVIVSKLKSLGSIFNINIHV